MENEYNAVIKRDGEWWVGWIEEIPGVNSQGATREELVANLQSALREMLRGHGMGCDAMDTGAACRTYNVLLSEGRLVAAALIPLP